MTTMYTALLIAHTFIAVTITVLVLLQRGKGADAGAGFGAGASGTVFGARGSTNFFSRATAVLAAAFFASSLKLAYLSSQQTTGPTSILEETAIQEPASVPAESNDDILPELPELDAVEPADSDENMPSLDAEPADADAIEAEDPQ
jgi:preprotein translocase subunit SecG